MLAFHWLTILERLKIQPPLFLRVKTKFAFALTAAFALASSTCKADHKSFLRRRNLNAEHDEMAFKKAKIITTKTLLNNSTITFYEPEEGIISVVQDSPPEAEEEGNDVLSSSKAAKSSSAGNILESPGELFKILTGEDVVPKSLVDAETRMKKHNAGRSLPPPPPSTSNTETAETSSMDDQVPAVNGDGRNLHSCSKWENDYCITNLYGASDSCSCWSCRTGNESRQAKSKAAFAQANPYRGSVSYRIRYYKNRGWRTSVGADVEEGRTNRLWSFGDRVSFWVELYNGNDDGWNWFVEFYDQDKSGGFSLVPRKCSKIY